MKCHCGVEYTAKSADLARGWALSCSKSCAAIRRDFGRPKATRVDGEKLPKKTKHGSKRITPDTRVYTNTREILIDLECDDIDEYDGSWDECDYHNHD
jgi:hypothetical protein